MQGSQALGQGDQSAGRSLVKSVKGPGAHFLKQVAGSLLRFLFGTFLEGLEPEGQVVLRFFLVQRFSCQARCAGRKACSTGMGQRLAWPIFRSTATIPTRAKATLAPTKHHFVIVKRAVGQASQSGAAG